MRIPSSSLQGLDRDYGAMTPMIDVVFNLLIFFVVAVGGSAVDMLLPTELSRDRGAVNVPTQPEERVPWSLEVWLKLRVDPIAGRTHVDMNGTVYSDIPRLKQQLRALAEVGPESPIILDAAPDVPFGDLIDLWDACRASGFQSINLATGPQ